MINRNKYGVMGSLLIDWLMEKLCQRQLRKVERVYLYGEEHKSIQERVDFRQDYSTKIEWILKMYSRGGQFWEYCSINETYLNMLKSLTSDITYQVVAKQREVREIVKFLVEKIVGCVESIKIFNKKERLSNQDEWTELTPPHGYVRVKNHQGATTKVNTTFKVIMGSIKRNRPKLCEVIRSYKHFVKKMYDDQAAAVALYTCAACDVYGDRLACVLGILGVLYPDEAKSLSTLFKALGLNATLAGAMVCELNTLQGRGVSAIDHVEEGLKRCSDGCIPDIGINDAILRKNIRDILVSEMGDCNFESLSDFWSKRWLWCANGAHNSAVERMNQKARVKYTGRLYRKVAAENWPDSNILGWDGRTIVTPSQKLEHGKSRLLLACDTVSYMCFEHLLQAVERSWCGKRVILNPGEWTSHKVRDWCWGRENDSQGYCVALDYDDFNSQHTLNAQKMVFEETIKLSGYDEARGKQLVESFDKMYIPTGSGNNRVRGTLLSGHRATTFINSVLNAAYIKSAVGSMWYSFRSIHIGDDVLITTDKAVIVDGIFRKLSETKLKLNPAKQSIGSVSGELLRVAHNKNGNSYGYLARAVASAVSGNWTSEKLLSSKERVTSCVTTTWTLMNRSGGNELPARVLAFSAARACNMDEIKIREMCTGRVAIFGGPSRYITSGQIECVSVRDSFSQDALDKWDEESVNWYATSDYMDYNLTSVERLLKDRGSGEMKRAMVKSSYRKAVMCSEKLDPLPGEAYSWREKAPVRLVSVRQLETHERRRGIFEDHPVISLMRYELDDKILAYLAREMGYQDYSELLGWGDDNKPCLFSTFMPYGEAASLCSRGGAFVVGSNANIFV